MEIEKMKPMEDWLSQFKGKTVTTYRNYFNDFLKWAKTNDEELVEIYKNAEDKNEWAREWGNILIRFQNDLLKKGYSRNTVRNHTTAVRSFFSTECQRLQIRKGRIASVQMAKGEHTFSQRDVQTMYHVADVRDKAILSTAISLGWGIGDFLDLEREFIEKLINRAKSEGQDFIRFDWERKKTGQPIMGVLTPEALDDLERWIEYSKKYKDSKGWLWASARRGRLKPESVNDAIQRLAEESGISLIGSIRFHLFRKFLMNTLATNGLNEFEVKIIVGKKVPLTDLTYLQTLKNSAFKKYEEAYPNFSLTTIVNSRIPKLQETVMNQQYEINDLETRLDILTKRNVALEKRLENFEILFKGIKPEILENMAKIFRNIEVVDGEVRLKSTKPNTS